MAQPIEQPAESAPRRSKKDRLLMQIKSLDDKDDEKTSISKRLSWLLRHGAKLAGVTQDPTTKWVKYADLCESEILKEYSSDLIWKVIVDFNGKKLRYEIGELEGVTHLRAYVRSEEHKQEQRKHDAPQKTGEGLRKDAPEFAPGSASVSAPADDDGEGSPSGVQAFAQAQQYAAYAAAMQTMFFNPMMSQYMLQATQGALAGKHNGWIKSFSVQKGFGFIECAATYAQYNRDVFLHKAQIKDLEVGAFVAFSCEVNKQGMPQAKDLVQLYSSKGGGKGKGGKGQSGEKGGKGGKGKGKGKGEGKGGKGGNKAAKEADAEAKPADEKAGGEAAAVEQPAAVAIAAAVTASEAS